MNFEGLKLHEIYVKKKTKNAPKKLQYGVVALGPLDSLL